MENLSSITKLIDNLTFDSKIKKEELEKKLKSWETQKLNIGVIGDSGCGKSTLINAIRGLFPSDEGAALTDVKEVVIEPTPYPFPKNSNIILWDLPGVNTPKYPLKDYLDRITYRGDKFLKDYVIQKLPINYDCYILCSTRSFKETDMELVKEIKKRGKNYIFVRLKFDEDIKGREKKLGRSLNDEEIKDLMEEMRDYINSNLVNDSFRPNPLMVSADMQKKDGKIIIDNRNKYEFNDLLELINSRLELEKKNALILSLMPYNEKIIKMKCNVLRDRIKYVSLLSGLGGLIPIPGVSIGIDITLLAEEVIFYIYQLNISKHYISNMCQSFGLHYSQLEEILNANSLFKSSINATSGVLNSNLFKESFKTVINLLIDPIKNMLIEYCSKYLTANIAEEIAKVALPVIGSVVGCAISIISTRYVLNKVLDSFEKALVEINAYCFKKGLKN